MSKMTCNNPSLTPIFFLNEACNWPVLYTVLSSHSATYSTGKIIMDFCENQHFHVWRLLITFYRSKCICIFIIYIIYFIISGFNVRINGYMSTLIQEVGPDWICHNLPHLGTHTAAKYFVLCGYVLLFSDKTAMLICRKNILIWYFQILSAYTCV